MQQARIEEILNRAIVLTQTVAEHGCISFYENGEPTSNHHLHLAVVTELKELQAALQHCPLPLPRSVDDMALMELDYWAARAQNVAPSTFAPTQNWEQAMRLLVDNDIQLFNMLTYWTAQITEQHNGKTRVLAHADRATQVEAIVACYVRLKLGSELPPLP